MINKTSLKFTLGFFGIIIVGLVCLVIVSQFDAKAGNTDDSGKTLSELNTAN